PRRGSPARTASSGGAPRSVARSIRRTQAGQPGSKVVDQAESRSARSGSLVRASSAMAVATAVSRVSGLLAKVLLVAVLGLGVSTDSYTVANTLPTVVNELLLGGVLTSIAVPLLVRAQQRGPAEGEAYAQWMITMGAVLLAAATVLAVLAAPLL